MRHVALKHKDGKKMARIPGTDPRIQELREAAKLEVEEDQIVQLVAGDLDPELLLADKVERRKANSKFGVQQTEIVFRFSKLARKLAAAGYFLYVLRVVFEYLVDFEGLRQIKGLVSSKVSIS
jgi:hypothetical protein